MSLVEIGARFKYNHAGLIMWLRQQGLLARALECPAQNCGHRCNEQNSTGKIDGRIWRCMNRACRRKHSIRIGSFFERSHLELWQILGLTYVWATRAGSSRGLSQNIIMHELNIGSCSTVVDWLQFCRLIPVTFFLLNPTQIGGAGHVVEIDESLFTKRKYHRGRVVPQQWIFGGNDQQTRLRVE